MKSFLLLLSIIFLMEVNVFSQNSEDTVDLILDFPLVDLGYQSLAVETTGGVLSSYLNPSMRQSLSLSNDLYSTAHWGVKKLFRKQGEFKRILFSNSLAMAFDFLSLRSPLSATWLHEEYHRAVLTRRGINSFNDINTFPYGSTTVAVRKIMDDELIAMSDQYNADFRRLMIAGNEASAHQIRTLQANNFYYSQDLPHIPLYWMSTMTNIFYVANSTSTSFDALIDEANMKEGTDISKRDFTGPDFTAWVDALFSPTKPYEERGAHPSGVGIDRYIKPSSLSEEAIGYLQRQGNLQWLNILSPHLFGFSKIKIFSNSRGDHYGNFAVRHLLTPFGNDVNIDLLYQTPKNNWFLSFHIYNNLNSTFGGIEIGLFDHTMMNSRLLTSVTGMVWTQPKDQSFFETDGDLGGHISMKNTYLAGKLNPYLQIDAKSAGWVMGNVFLDRNVSLIIGLSARIN